MIVRSFDQPLVQNRMYKAHGGADASMLFASNELEGLLFMAQAVLPPGKTIEAHIDPYEEIYYILKGQGIMMVDGESQEARPGDTIWIPYGVVHSLDNPHDEECIILVAASMPR
jgi:quercetin dioxygenase-like cupin family protein